jgi:hypothetical protein
MLVTAPIQREANSPLAAIGGLKIIWMYQAATKGTMEYITGLRGANLHSVHHGIPIPKDQFHQK